MNKTTLFLVFLLCISSYKIVAQTDEDAFFIKKIYDTTLVKGQSYNWLYDICTKIGGRISGSPQSLLAVDYTMQQLKQLPIDTVRLQKCRVPYWIRGNPEVVQLVNVPNWGTIPLQSLALGNSVATPPSGITAPIIEVKTLEELDELGESNIAGKIVFFNRPMNPTQLNTFSAYGGAVDQRVFGPSKAAQYGAIATLVRSITTLQDNVPHTGVTVYEEGVSPIPALAISTNNANFLSDLLKTMPIEAFIKTDCRNEPLQDSYNVIAELKGTTYPDEIILVGGHLDAWDIGQGAHDDGAGCVQAMEVLNILTQLGYKPKRTLRCVLFMNEENGQAGAIAYKEASDKNKEYHLAAIESDRGGFTPRGFTCDGDKRVFIEHFQKITQWLPLLEPYGLTLKKGGSGADINRLKNQKGLLIGFEPDTQRYFDYHHTVLDTIDAVNERELKLGAAAIATLVYLLDKYGL